MSDEVWMMVAHAHAFATLGMVGVIWFVQVVHYPLMGSVGGERWLEYAARHTARTTLVVGPLMLVEAATAAALLARSPDDVILIIGGVLLAVAWISTFAVQVRLHGELGKGFDAQTHTRLVRTNWVRTAAWSARGVLALLVLA